MKATILRSAAALAVVMLFAGPVVAQTDRRVADPARLLAPEGPGAAGCLPGRK
jgi:hypothetical protein